MTTATATATPATGRGSGALTGTATLLRFMLRRDRIRLPAWLIGISIFVPYCFAELRTAFPTEADLATASGFTSGPMLALFGGPGYGMQGEDLSYVTFFAGIYAMYLMLAAAVMNILFVSRHTRVEEQTGRAELVRANVVGRHAALAATTILAMASNLVLSVLILAALRASDAPLAGSAAVAAGIGLFGMVFAGVSMTAVQISEYSAAASGLAGGILGGAFVIRAAGDMIGEHGSALSWITPFAWSQQTRAFVDERWWPLAISLVVCAALVTTGFALSTRRDLGAGLRATRRGRTGARAWLRSPLMLAWRLHRGSVRGWAVGLILGGVVYGTTTQTVVDSFADMTSEFTQMLSTAGGSLLMGYLNMMIVIMVITTAVFEFLAVLKVRSEETGGRAEPVLATAVGKKTWLGAHLLVISAAALVLLVASCAAMGFTAAVGTGDWSLLGKLTVAGLVYSPALLLIAALAATCYGLHPRLLGLAAAVLVFSGLAAVFGELLNLPEAVMAISPWHHTPAYPVESVTAAPLIVQAAVFAALAGLGLGAFARRDLASV